MNELNLVCEKKRLNSKSQPNFNAENRDKIYFYCDFLFTLTLVQPV